MIERARLLNKLNGWSVKLDEQHVCLGDLTYNEHGQTTNEVLSFTYALSHLIATAGGPFITALTEEATAYIDEYAARDYVEHVRIACERHNVEISGDLAETFALYATFDDVTSTAKGV
jgi:hypothetical protein